MQKIFTMKKINQFYFLCLVLLGFQNTSLAQDPLTMEAQRVGDIVEVTWIGPGLEGPNFFSLSRTSDSGWENLDNNIPGEVGVMNYNFTDNGPFTDELYTYYLQWYGETPNNFIDSTTAIVSFIDNPSFIKINLMIDSDENCMFDASELPFAGMGVQVTNGDETYYGTTNANGMTTITVESPDTYEVSIPSVQYYPYWNLCQESFTVDSEPNQTSEVTFLLDEIEICPDLWVDLGTFRLRRCTEETYYIYAGNQGTEPAIDPYVTIEFDPFLTVVNSSLSWSNQVDNTYTFDLQDLAVNETEFFTVTVSVDCDVPLGQTHCSTAHIYPDSICTEPSVDWDGSSVKVSGECINDEVQFTIENVGTGNMLEALEYIVIQDNILLDEPGDFQLVAGQQLQLPFMPAGATLRLEADQANGHPGFSMPTVAVEGCGGTPFSTGFVTIFGEDDQNFSVDTDCQENVDSYDPNDKQGFPKGYGNANYIRVGEEIDYLIRFQNTGTAPAINVNIVDQIDPGLDFSTLRPGASSHDYTYEVFGDREINFKFANINLPDSVSNEPESHGFVKFKIKPLKDLPLETTVFNKAAIYFDFNPPVLTNETQHTIGEKFILTDIQNLLGASIQTKVQPNPFSISTTIIVEGMENQQLTFRLYDQLGQLVRQEQFADTQLEFVRGNLSPGIYFFEIADAKQKISIGKIIAD